MREIRVGDVYRHTFNSDEFHTKGECYTILEIRDDSEEILISSNQTMGYFVTAGSLCIFFEPVSNNLVLMKDLFSTVEES